LYETPSRVQGVGNLFRFGVPFVGQEAGQRGCGVGVMAQMLIALPDPQLSLGSQRVLRKILQEAPQGGDAQ
jgi:hypothetical protein